MRRLGATCHGGGAKRAAPVRGALTESPAMRLFALRGAISVARNDAQDILDATTELMRRSWSATRSRPRTSSAASSPRRTTSTPSSRPSPRVRSASTAYRCCAHARSPCPAALPRVIRVLIHYYAEEGHEAKHVYLGEAARAARRSRGGAVASPSDRCPVRNNTPVAIEFSERIRRIPVYPAAGGYADAAPPIRLASNESPYPPLPAVQGSDRSGAGEPQPLSRPLQLAAAHAPVRDATGCPPSRSRSATARATSCWPPARRCWSPAPSWCTRGPRSRCTPT